MKKEFLPNIYGADQLFTASGLDQPTDYRNMLTLMSRKQRFSYSLMLPEPAGQLRLPDFGGALVVGSDFADFGKSRMLLADAWNLLIQGEVQITELDTKAYRLEGRNGLTLLGVRPFFHAEFLDADFDALFDRKCDYITAMGDLGAKDGDTRRALARAWSQLRGHIYSAEEKFTGRWVTPDRWPHRDCWIMDSVYQSLGIRHFDLAAAQEAVCALFAHQQPDGNIPMMASPAYTSRVFIQQPIIAAGVKAVGIHGDALRQVYPRLAAYLNWVFAHRDLDGDGLLEWVVRASDKQCICAESGMDNSPRFDEGTPLASVDLNCFVSHEFEIMAEFARELDLPGEAKAWQKRHHDLNQRIEAHLWNARLGIYCDMDIFCCYLRPVAAVSGFLPLLCGAASKARAAKLVELIHDPQAFGTPCMLPSVSVSDPAFQLDMWRGPVWDIFNYLVCEGLDRYGYAAEARLIRKNTVQTHLKFYQDYGGFYEFHDPFGKTPPGQIDRKGPNHPDDFSRKRAIHDYGWTAALFIDMTAKLNHQKEY